MSSPLDTISIGDKFHEVDPWTERVIERLVIRIAVFEEKDRYASHLKRWRKVWVEGGFLGAGEELTENNLNKKYFDNLPDARKYCVERVIEIREEHKRQLQKEAEQIASELNKLK